jgi:hypothetical protein
MEAEQHSDVCAPFFSIMDDGVLQRMIFKTYE